MNSWLRFVLQIALILCAGACLRADESQYLLTPQSSIGQTDARLHNESAEIQRDLSLLPLGQRNSQRHPLRTVVSSLAIVLGAFLLAAAILRKQGKSQTRRSVSPSDPVHGLMENMGELQLTPTVKLNLVRVGSRLLVLNLSDDGVQTVAEITNDEDVQQLLSRSQEVPRDLEKSEDSVDFELSSGRRSAFKSFDEFDSHPQVGDLLRRVEGQVKEFA